MIRRRITDFKLAKKRIILRPAKKLGMILLLLVQVFRMACVAATLYVVFVTLVMNGKTLTVFEPQQNYHPCQPCQPCHRCQPLPSNEETQNQTNNSSRNFAMDQPASIMAQQDRANRVQYWVNIAVPSVEIAVSLLITYLIMGPLSRQISVVQWIKWLLKLRMFWMRLIWAAAGSIYAVVLLKMRQLKYEDSLSDEYYDGALVKIGLALTAVEYACLGMVESVMKVVKTETIERRLHNHDKGIIGSWKKLCMVIYYLATLAYALRNFSMSLYFGILSAVASTALDISVPTAFFKTLKGVVLVLQIYLAVMRGKFYAFFMRNLLSNFLWEVDNKKLQGDLQNKLSVDKELEREMASFDAIKDHVPKTEVV